MKRFLTLAVVGVLALGLTSTAYANLCSSDVVPAATLLFPFVAYDYDGGATGQNTLFAITNVSSAAQIVHITVWTDYSIAILDFNIVLTGYDVQTIKISDILGNGMLPYEGTGANIWEINNEGESPEDLGPFSSNNQLYDGDLDVWFAAVGLDDPESTSVLLCDPAVYDASPNNYGAELPIDTITLGNFRNFLEASMLADKWYANCNIVAGPPLDSTETVLGDGSDVIPEGDYDSNVPTPWWLVDTFEHPAWMYITADIVGACNKDLPDNDAARYFGTSGEGIGFTNVLMGDVVWVDPAEVQGDTQFSEADNAVHIEAGFNGTTPFFPPSVLDDESFPTTFYSRYHVGAGALVQDYREPLGTALGLRYIVNPNSALAANTWVRAWKGSTNQALVQDLNDGSYTVDPDELYANSCTPYTYYAWDEDENVLAVSGGFIPPWSGEDPQPLPQPNLFPLETQEVNANQFYLVGDWDDPDVGAFGWMLFVWPRSNTTDFPATTGALSDQYQTWMGVKYQAYGNSSAALSGADLGNWNCDATSSSLPFRFLGRSSFSE